jgi:hypothetical protein
MASAPAKDLAEVLELSNYAEKLIGDLAAHVRDCVREASGAGSLGDIHRIGRALKAASGLQQETKEPAE